MFLAHFLMIQLIKDTIRKIEYNLQQDKDVNEAYKSFSTRLCDEMDNKLPPNDINLSVSRAKLKLKRYWREELQAA